MESKLKPLKRAYEVDEAINTAAEKCIVIVRFSRETKKDDDVKTINQVDEWLQNLDPKKYSVGIEVYTVQMKAVPELVARYKLMDPVTVLFFRDNIQGGRVQGSGIKKQDIEDAVKKLDAKKKDNPQPPKAAAAGTGTRAGTGDKVRMREPTIRIGRYRKVRWWEKLNLNNP